MGRRLFTKVNDIMISKEKVATAKKDDLLLTIIDKLTEKNLGIVCIEDDNKIIGIITDGDIRRLLNEHKEKFFKMYVKDVMITNFKFISSNLSALDALEIMEEKNKTISVIPVLKNRLLVGSLEFMMSMVLNKFNKYYLLN